ncbi:PAS domain-containing protein [Stigmatella sp. ncwal1]|uniref:protein-glutamate O-methyltransferase n=1 Tax=Stigmatella ashevillensis TaxID=2995309 RepID=A0ABT5DB95_9BACT|nr:CheR family methyltransferase [Stigmatella ashevillena]MDC0710921.1 PAS domain-containing protein [Stigmatella ashevillena]
MASKPPRDSELEAILEKVRQVRSFDFRSYKRATLQRRIDRRMAATHCRTRTAYLALLERDANEVNTLVSSMLIKLTTFFRDPEVWTSLEKVVRDMVRKRRPEQELRIWSAGCATGEEAYSIAIIAAEALGPGLPGTELKVFGTDVDEAAIAFARRGVYTAQQLESCSKERLARWFVPASGGYAVRKEIRRTVVFGVNNLVSDAPVSRIDLILCRNVFIYLDAELQKRSLARFHFALRQEGVLALGRSELIPFAAKLFEPVDLTRRIYRKDGRQELTWAPQDRVIHASEPTEPGRFPPDAQHPRDAQRVLLREVLDSHPCPVIATDNEGGIILFNQAAARLWGRTEADVSGKRLVSLALPGLSQDLLVEQSARVKAGRSEREVGDGTLKLLGAEPVAIRVLVVPLRSVSADAAGLLYVAHDVTTLRSLEQNLQLANDELNNANLRLQSSNEEMRAANEELETTNEELQSANEELQTTNEELQSTNEELETTNEELQSTNAELDATNRELAHRTQEMDALSFCQNTIIRALSEGTVVLDPTGHISTWNLAAERLLGLTEREALGQVLWTLSIPALSRSLLTRIRKHLTANRTLRQEDVSYQLPHGGRGRATLVAIPLIMDSQVLGAIILFEDTTRLNSLTQKNREMKERLKT